MVVRELIPDRAVTWGLLVHAETEGTLERNRQGIAQGKDYQEKEVGRGFQEKEAGKGYPERGAGKRYQFPGRDVL